MSGFFAIFTTLSTLALGGIIKELDRSFTFADTDPMVVVNNIKFKPETGDDKYFYYTVNADYSSNLASVQVTDVLRGQDATLPIKMVPSTRNATLLWFEVDIEELVSQSKDSYVYLQFSEMHKRRKVAYPEQVSLTEKQAFRLTDSGVATLPYFVEQQTFEIQLPKNSKLTGMTKHPDTSYEENKIQFGGTQKNVEAMSFQQLSVQFEHTIPYVILTEANKKVTVSHWGSIQVDEYFKIENIGAKLKGQYSRIDLDMMKAGKNCLRNMHSEYPYYIKGLYVHDYIGNISSSHAERTNTNVEMDLKPRFPICGGWQTDWNQGYSMPTRFVMSESTQFDNLYKVSLPFYHSYDVLMTEEYQMQIVLPMGASDINVSESWVTNLCAG
jgi:oligosaccharyltransferase complex subunit alpha (ribophorin I)